MTGWTRFFDDRGRRYKICSKCGGMTVHILPMRVGGELCPHCKSMAETRSQNRRIWKRFLNRSRDFVLNEILSIKSKK